jgi:hypothetical protein
MSEEHGGDQFVIPEAIRSLLEQRAQYMEWLAKLDDLGGQYRPEVARRVRADYRHRLTGVEDELHGHKEELEASLGERQSRLASLEERHDLCAAELEEIELRHQVGEFDRDEWDSRKTDHENELQEIVAQLDSEREAVSELGSVLVQVSAPSEASATRHVEPGAWSEPAAEVVPVVAEDDVILDSEESYEDEEEDYGEDVDTPDAEMEAVEDAEAEEPVEEIGVGESTREDAGGDEFLDELEFLESLSLDDPESFDAVSKMLEDEGEGAGGDEESESRGGAG